MTVAVAVKVFDGIVLATDSATTFQLMDNAGKVVGAQVYNNANKIFELHRTKHVGCMTWGLGNVGPASIATICKDLRRRLMGREPGFEDWALGDDYTIESVAARLVQMLCTELIPSEYPPGVPLPSDLGLLVAGYSGGATQPEAWSILILPDKASPTPAQVLPPQSFGWKAWAQPEATERMFQGIDSRLLDELRNDLPPFEFAKIWKKLTVGGYAKSPVHPAMPFADAAEVARFLVDVTAGYSHALLGPDTVGGAVEVAGINRHEGFKWISRKHYYPEALNREARHDT